jgi:hypothetical protein
MNQFSGLSSVFICLQDSLKIGGGGIMAVRKVVDHDENKHLLMRFEFLTTE